MKSCEFTYSTWLLCLTSPTPSPHLLLETEQNQDQYKSFSVVHGPIITNVNLITLVAGVIK